MLVKVVTNPFKILNSVCYVDKYNVGKTSCACSRLLSGVLHFTLDDVQNKNPCKWMTWTRKVAPWKKAVRVSSTLAGCVYWGWSERVETRIGEVRVRKWASWAGREADIDSMARWRRERRKWDEMLKRRVRAVAWRHPSTDLRENIAKVDEIKRGCVQVVHNGGYECSLDEANRDRGDLRYEFNGLWRFVKPHGIMLNGVVSSHFDGPGNDIF